MDRLAGDRSVATSDDGSGASGAFRARSDVAARLVRRAAARPEAPMRVEAVARELGRGSGLEAVGTLEMLMREALGREPAALATYDALVEPEALASSLGEARLRSMLEAGIDDGCAMALSWLRGLLYPQPPMASLDASRLVAWGLREMTLGERRSLARRARGDTITQLVVDPDPVVIENLLNNPRVTERAVLAICTRRPTLPAPLRSVLRAPRWFRHYAVKLSLVRNPYLELRYGSNLLVYLKRPDLQDVRNDETLSPFLRSNAERFLEVLAGL